MVPDQIARRARRILGSVITAHPEILGLTDWRPLARGGFATVWQARQETLNRLVAVKVDQRTLDADKEQRRFLREAGAAGRMSGHPGIVTVHDAGILADGRPYLVMELCPGGSLTKWLKPDHRPTQEQVREVGIRIADALASAHEHGVLHRDVKPANIMIDSYGNPGLVDFGLAAMPQPGQDLSVTMEALTPAYAPKEVLYQRPPSEFGDVFSLAATLYALLDGKPPRWPDEGSPSLPEIFELQSKPVERLQDVNPQLMNVLMNALADDATARPSAAEFRDQLKAVDLAAAPSERPPIGPPPPTPASPARPERGYRRRRLPLLIGLVAALLAAVVVGGMALGALRQPGGAVTPPAVPPTPTPAASSTEPAPSPSPSPTSPTGLPLPPGFLDCSSLLGEGVFCPTEPECWIQYTSTNDFPAVANPTSCEDLHQNETFAAGRLGYPIRLQSQLQADRFVKRLCRLASVRKVVVGERVEGDWGVEPYPPQLGGPEGFFRCLVTTGENRDSPLEFREP